MQTIGSRMSISKLKNILYFFATSVVIKIPDIRTLNNFRPHKKLPLLKKNIQFDKTCYNEAGLISLVTISSIFFRILFF